jgi:hypothetical protein
MAVLKEFSCAAHGAFEEMVEQSEMPKCPRGCPKRFVTREIRTAPAGRATITGTLDHLQRELAHDFGLSDIKVGKDDNKSVMQNLREGKMMQPEWVDVPGHLKPGFSQRKDQAAPVNISSSFGAQPDNALERVAPPKNVPTRIVGATAERAV